MTLRDEFERCWPWLDASLASFGRTHSKQHVWDRIAAGRAQLWPAERAGILTETIHHPIGFRSLNITRRFGVHVAGSDRRLAR